MGQNNRPLGRPPQDNIKKPTRVLILEKAVQLFLHKGYQLVSMDDVAKECGVTKATVYYYYSTKADLFTDAMFQMMVRISERISELLSTSNSLRENLLQIVKIHLKSTFEIDLKAFMKDAKVSLSEEQIRQMNEAEEKMYSVLEAAIKRAMDEGVIPQGNPKFGAHAFFAIVTVGNYRDKNQKALISSVDLMAEQIMDFFWKGLTN